MASIPVELDEIVQKLLAKNPLDRPFNARQVQGVMYQIIDKYGLESVAPQLKAGENTKKDVGADEAVEVGRRQLQRRIAARLGEGTAKDISWPMLFLIAIVLVLATALLVMFNN